MRSPPPINEDTRIELELVLYHRPQPSSKGKNVSQKSKQWKNSSDTSIAVLTCK